MMQLCEMECGPPDPATAVLVVNIAGVKGRNCPSYHWVYLPSSRSGIHRIGFYSHVDELFLPAKYRGRSDIVSIYAERSFASGAAPSAEEQVSISRAVVDELRDFEFIQQAIVVDSSMFMIARIRHHFAKVRPRRRQAQRSRERRLHQSPPYVLRNARQFLLRRLLQKRSGCLCLGADHLQRLVRDPQGQALRNHLQWRRRPWA